MIRTTLQRRRTLKSQHLAALAALLMLLAAPCLARAQYFPDDRNSCRSCHVDARNKTDFCELFEATIYERDDKHGRAFFLLHETDPADPEKGQAKRDLVRQILGFELREAFADDRYSRLKDATNDETRRQVATVKACLRCHATWPAAADAATPTQPPVALELGVSCQACHGPGVKWNLAHYLPPHAWRAVTPEAKAALGFTDVRSPEKKAQLCMSCHVGSIEQEKFVKHEWYAAGHPPLPGFELASFQAQMPVHWKPISAKGNFAFRDGTLPRQDPVIAATLRTLQDAGIPEGAIKANYLEANSPAAPEAAKDLPQTKDAIVAGAAVLEMYARLVGDYADSAVQNKSAWPELALYDCTACHHELRSGLGLQSRQRRSHPPGRPPLATWPATLGPLAAHQAANYDAAESQSRWSVVMDSWRQLERATTVRPFGDPAVMRTAARSLSATAAQLTADVAHSRFDQAAATKAMQLLTDPGAYESADFSTARQAAWAMRGIASDLRRPAAEDMFRAGSDDPLALALPSGPERSVMENLKRWLPAAARYDPVWFREELNAARAK